MRYHKYARLLPNGEWEHMRVPEMFGPEDVAKHSTHSVVCMFVRKGWRVSVDRLQRFVEGPTWVVFDKEKGEWAAEWKQLETVPHSLAYQFC